MSTELLKRLLSQRRVYRTGELTGRGVATRTILRGIESGLVVRPVFVDELGAVPGIIAAASCADSPELGACVATLLTGGVISGQYAAAHHGLTTSIENRIEITALKGTSAPPRQANVEIRWTRLPEHLEFGVETEGTSLGIPLRVTGKARTIVDLLRAQRADADDHRHGLYALNTFLEQGGQVSEIMETAERFGKAASHDIGAMCAGVAESLQRSFGA